MTLKCCRCDEMKPTAEFYWRSDRNYFRQPCRQCYGEETKERIARDPERRRAISRASYIRNRDDIARRARERTNRFRFGLESGEYEELLAEQGGVCAICRRPESVTDPREGHVRSLAIDHCHETRVVRGLLCARCNMALGMFGDDAEILRAALTYLEGDACDARTTSQEVGTTTQEKCDDGS